MTDDNPYIDEEIEAQAFEEAVEEVLLEDDDEVYSVRCEECGSEIFTRSIDDSDLLVLSCAECGATHQVGISLE